VTNQVRNNNVFIGAMSPASSGALEVERYIGACLISSQQSRYKKHNNHQDLVFSNNYQQRCNSEHRWAGGMPLISYQHQHHQHHYTARDNFARLAVQGAPLILSNNKYHRQHNKHRRGTANLPIPTTSSGTLSVDIKEKQHQQQHQRDNKQLENCTDTVSVNSDESSSTTSSTSSNSDNCLPRIIKPRKRRKKDRKFTNVLRTQDQESFTDSSANPSPEIILPPTIEYPKVVPATLTEEYPNLHHSFEDIEESKDLNGNESSCQCRYCNPSQIWDIDRNCYSPFLTTPSPFTFSFIDISNSNRDRSNTDSSNSKRHSSPISESSNSFIDSISLMSLEDEKEDVNSPVNYSQLEFSTEIVTSLNGHRDLEIKFFSALSNSVNNRSNSNNINSSDTENSQCIILNI